MICAFCKTKYPKDYKWCMECGSELEQDTGQHDAEIAAMSSADEFPAAAVGGAVCAVCGAAMTANDTFCGGCGSKVSAPAAATAPMPAARAASLAGACARCGIDLIPGDTFCGACGHPVGPVAVPQPAPVPAAPLLPPPAPAAPACPKCGMVVMPGEAFCGACGNPMTSLAPPGPIAPPPAPAEIPCPNCGMDMPPGADVCPTCGKHMGAAIETEAPFAPPSGIAEITESIPVCPTCGIEAQPGETFCAACGSALNGSPAVMELAAPAPPPPSPEPFAAPPPPPAAGGDKICSCCGTGNPSTADFCANCGVDFD